MKRNEKNDLAKRLDIPEGFTFCAFAVGLPDSDEFLMKYTDSVDMVGKLWTSMPDLALRFSSEEEARRVALLCGGFQAFIFEDAKRYMVRFIDPRPLLN